MAFYDMMRINISIFTSLNQVYLEVEIKHAHYTRIIILFLRNWRPYEGLLKHEEDGDKEKFNIIENLKNSNDYNA